MIDFDRLSNLSIFPVTSRKEISLGVQSDFKVSLNILLFCSLLPIRVVLLVCESERSTDPFSSDSRVLHICSFRKKQQKIHSQGIEKEDSFCVACKYLQKVAANMFKQY